MGLLSFLAPIVGGLLSKPKEVSSQDQTYGGIMGQASGARDAAEKYGFNPLTLLGVSSPLSGYSIPNSMGSAISDAAMTLASQLAERPGAGEKDALERQNADLRKRLEQETLRPRVGGIYAERERTPTIAEATGEETIDPLNRPERVTPDTNASGSFLIENNATGGSIRLPGDGEPWGIDEVATGVVVGAPQAAFNWGGVIGRSMAESRDREAVRRSGRGVFRMEDGQLYAPYVSDGPVARQQRSRTAPAFGFSPNPYFGF